MTADNIAKTVGKYRWMICLLLFANTANNYLDRQMLGILAPMLGEKYGWTELEWARVVIAFQVAYAVGLPFFGRLVDKFGTRATYAWATIFWGFAAYGHALCSRALHFGIVRFVLGLGEAVNFPAAIKAITEWFPKKERALATGIFNSGANIGAVITPALVPWLAVNYGWQWAFVVGGSINFVFVALWWPLYRRPQESRGVLQSELKHILSDSGGEGAQAKIPWGDLLRYRETWAFIVGKFMTDPIWWFYLFWLPKWLAKDFNLDLKNLGWPLIVVYMFVTIGSVGGGYISSALIQAGRTVNFARKSAFLICATLVVPIFMATRVGNVWIAVLLVGLAAAAHQGWSANLFTLVSDCFPKNAVASVVGLGGMAGSIGAILFAEFVGRVLEKTGQYWLLFLIGSTAYLMAFVVIHLLVPRIRSVFPEGAGAGEEPSGEAMSEVPLDRQVPETGSVLAGIDGWLLVPASSLVLVPLTAVVTLVLSLAQLTKAPAGAHQVFLVTSVAAQGILIVLMLVAAARFFDRRRSTPTLMIAVQVAQCVLAGVVMLVGRSDPTIPLAGLHMGLFAASVIFAALLIPYFRRSVRVRETFVV
jgi:ACS family hexuronate transporter-like MFS transporter